MGKYPGSIPMEVPLAFFLAWTTYGSWLFGDEQAHARFVPRDELRG